MGELRGIETTWARGQAAFGVFARTGAPSCVEVIARAGVDYVCLDLQHGVGGFDSLPAQIAACREGRTAAVVRVPSNEAWQIGRALDLGARGVIVPLVSGPREAAQAVASCRYPPEGVRSHGPVRDDDTDGAERQPLCFVMVETLEGLNQVEQIAATPGLTGIYIGVTDIAMSLGLGPRAHGGHTEHANALERIRLACEDARIIAGMHCHNGRDARERSVAGFRFITIASDFTLLRGSIVRELAFAAADAAPEQPSRPQQQASRAA